MGPVVVLGAVAPNTDGVAVVPKADGFGPPNREVVVAAVVVLPKREEPLRGLPKAEGFGAAPNTEVVPEGAPKAVDLGLPNKDEVPDAPKVLPLVVVPPKMDGVVVLAPPKTDAAEVPPKREVPVEEDPAVPNTEEAPKGFIVEVDTGDANTFFVSTPVILVIASF